MIRAILMTLCICIPFLQPEAAEARVSTIQVNAASTWPVGLSEQTDIFEDVKGELDFSDIQSQPFRPATPSDFKPRFTSSTIWLRFTVVNTGPDLLSLFLLAGSPRNHHQELYWRVGTVLHAARAGAAVPLAEQPTPSRLPLFSLALPASTPTSFFLKVKTGTPLRLNPQLFSESAFLLAESNATFWNALLIGGLCAFAFCSFLVFAFSGASSFGWLAVLGMLIAGFEIAQRGYGKTVLWPHWAEWNYRSTTVFGASVIVLFVVFGVSISRRENFTLPYKRGLVAFACAMAVIAGIGAIGDLTLAARLTIYASMGFTVAKIVIAAMLLKHAVPSAKLLLATACIALVHVFVRMFEESGTTLVWAMDPRLGFDPNPWLALVSFAANLALLAAWVSHIGTQRLAAREELVNWQRNEQERLREEVKRQTAALNESLTYAERRNQERAHVLGYVSHDLRAPLATVAGYLRLLRKEAPASQLPQLNAIERSLQYQDDLIRDILEFSKGELAPLQLDPQPLNLGLLFDGCVEYGQALAAEYGNRFDASIDVSLNNCVVADGTRLQQVVLNLLTNAAKFTVNGTVRLKAVAVQEGATCRLAVSVLDDGPGVDESVRDRIFGRFVRAHNDSSGVGLGLYISKDIVSSMGGTLDLSTAQGVGSDFSFHVVLPIDPTPIHLVSSPGRPVYQRRSASQLVHTFSYLPPAHLRIKLASYAREGRVTEIENWVADVLDSSPQLGPFVSAVDRALEVLDLSAVESLALSGRCESTYA